MHKKLLSTVSIFTVTLAFMIIFLYATLQIYRLTLNETKASHQQQQMEMAKAVTLGITTYLENTVEDMRLLILVSEPKKNNDSVIKSNIEFFYDHYEKNMIRSIFLTDESGNINYVKGEMLPDWLPQVSADQSRKWAEPGLPFQIWYSSVLPNFYGNIDTGLSFCILIPYYKKSGENANSTGDPPQKTVSLIGYVIDFELLVEVFIQPIKLSKDDFAWAMDGNGRLIYHPRHRTMLLRTIERLEKDCMECHASFELQKKITMEPASFGEYKIGTEPTKIMAAVPIELHNEKWILVITSVLPQVTENLRNNFRNFFILGMIILIAILSFGLTLYYVNTRRIRAEESNRQAENMQILQEQLNQSTKLASVGELVDTVAHEINTPVGIISAQADAMFLQGEISDRFAEEITIIKQQIRRISKYTRSLLGYSRRAVFAPNPNDIVELLEECLYLLGHRFRAHDIIITREFSSSLPKILMDRGQMEQVFINLLNNAIDAIDQKGKIQIKVYIQNGIDQHTSANGLAIEIADNGKGISTQEKDKIFSAFYTSKKPSQGTGLGLYISKSIIQRHQGIISFSENQPTGTIFKIYLPFNQDRSI